MDVPGINFCCRFELAPGPYCGRKDPNVFFFATAGAM
jgi:hypothetical protein